MASMMTDFSGQIVHIKRRAGIVLVLAALFFTAGAAQVEKTLPPKTIADLVEEFPAENGQELDRLASAILDLGSGAVEDICAILSPPGRIDDSRARFALGGLAAYVGGQGKEEARALFAGGVVRALDRPADKEVKAFLIRLLQRCGGRESAGPLKVYLNDTALCQPAVSALQAISSARAERILARSLDSVPARNRVPIVKALGEMKNTRAVKKMLVFSGSRDAALRGAALFALANIGDGRAENVLSRFTVAASPFERARASSLYLLYAQRLGESGDIDGCARICRDLIDSYTARTETNIPCAALDTLVDLLGEKAYPDLLDAVGNPHKAVRVKALSLAFSFPGPGITASWVERIGTSPPEIRAEIVEMLGKRGDRSALPAVLAELESEHSSLRAAAVDASRLLGGEAVLERLWPLLDTDSPEVIAALRRALLSFPAGSVVAKAASLVESSPPPVRMALIEVLAERRATEHAEIVFAQAKSDDKDLRLKALEALQFLCGGQDLPRLVGMMVEASENPEVIALQDTISAAALLVEDPQEKIAPLLDAFEKAEIKGKVDILRLFPRIGGETAFRFLTARTEDEDIRIQTAAVSGLSRWPDPVAMEALEDIITGTKNSTFRYVCLRGFVRLLGETDLTAAGKFARVEEIMSAAETAEDKKALLSGMGGIKDTRALDWAVPFLDDPQFQPDAARAVIGIVMPEEGEELGLASPEAEAALIRAADILQNEDTWNQVRGYLESLWKRNGFVLLFNGNDLSGWQGDTAGYAADEGRIVVSPEKGSGNLYTQNQYGDFILRFEFKLTPGANNGLGIRTPLKGDAAYAGIELQILDNTAEMYKDLQPYQYHGSLYGVFPAKRGFLRPVGEWNIEEVTARGKQIIVRLNGEVILDADIGRAIDQGTMDGREHPGLLRDRGYIGFLGHGSAVEFRHIWIKELK